MSDSGPGPGWRMVDDPADDGTGRRKLVEYDEDGYPATMWVREAPVPPLPTAPYTVIRVTSMDGKVEYWYLNGRDHMWWEFEIEYGERTPFELQKAITGFEVLSEPRAVTADKVLGRVAEEHAIRAEQLDQIASEFRLES